jgi:hypothetical protein
VGGGAAAEDSSWTVERLGGEAATKGSSWVVEWRHESERR